MFKRKLIIGLIFGVIQTLFASTAIVLAMLLKMNIFNFKSSMGVPTDGLDFYVVILLGIGFVSILAGIFPICDWWNSR